MNNKGFAIPITFYIIAGLAVVSLIMGFWISRDHQKILRLESELGTTKATLEQDKKTAKIQRDADAKALVSTQGLLRECLDSQPVCPPTKIECPSGKCNVTVEPCESPW